MDRLTERDAFGDPNIPGLPGEQTYRAIINALNKLADLLADLEDAEEQGRLVKPSCAEKALKGATKCTKS